MTVRLLSKRPSFPQNELHKTVSIILIVLSFLLDTFVLFKVSLYEFNPYSLELFYALYYSFSEYKDLVFIRNFQNSQERNHGIKQSFIVSAHDKDSATGPLMYSSS